MEPFLSLELERCTSGDPRGVVDPLGDALGAGWDCRRPEKRSEVSGEREPRD